MIKTESFFPFVVDGRRDFFQSMALASPLAESHFQENTETDLYCTGLDSIHCNGVIEKTDNRDISENEIQKTIQFFREKRCPFIWWTSCRKLENFGFQYGGMMKGVAQKLPDHPLQPFELPKNIFVQQIESAKEIALFSAITAEGFGMPKKTVQPFTELNINAMKTGKQIHFLAFFEHTPVGTISLTVKKDVIGGWNFVILPNYRRQGLGKVLLSSAIYKASTLAEKHLIGILMPEKMAWTVAKQQGFVEVCSFPFYSFL